jgi:hypothetical protein
MCNLKIPFANMRRLFRYKSTNKVRGGGTASCELCSKEKIVTGQTIGAFQGKPVPHGEMLRRQVLGLGGYTLGLLGPKNYLDYYAEAKSTPIRCLVSISLVKAGREVQAAMAVLRGEYLTITAALDALGARANANAAAVDKFSKGKIDKTRLCAGFHRFAIPQST